MSDRFMDYITIKEASEQWGVSTRAITYHVVSGRFEGAIKKGNMWLVPSSAKRPEDLRKNNRRQPKKETRGDEGWLRRSAITPEIITKGSLTLKIMSDEAFIGDGNLLLSQKEFSLLFLFVQNENKVMSAEYIYEKVWGKPMLGNKNAVRSSISRLREKLKDSGYTIAMHYGKGYAFEKL